VVGLLAAGTYWYYRASVMLRYNHTVAGEQIAAEVRVSINYNITTQIQTQHI